MKPESATGPARPGGERAGAGTTLRLLPIALLRLAADAPLAWMLWSMYFPRPGTGGPAAAARNAALFVAFAALHSALARRAPKRLVERLLGPLWVRPLFVAISGLTLAALLYLWRPLAGTLWHAGGAARWVLSLLFAASVGGLAWAASCIDYADFLGIRPLQRSARGQARKSAGFSARGPYAYCRHPMYGFLLAALWVGPVMTFGRLEFAVLASLYLLAGTLLEERNLRAELGEIYDDYRENVPMWLPRLSPWRPPGSSPVSPGGVDTSHR